MPVEPHVLINEPTLKDTGLRHEVQELMRAAERVGCRKPEGIVKLQKAPEEEMKNLFLGKSIERLVFHYDVSLKKDVFVKMSDLAAFFSKKTKSTMAMSREEEDGDESGDCYYRLTLNKKKLKRERLLGD